MDESSTVYRYLDHRKRHLFSVVRHIPKRFELLGPDKRTIHQFPETTVLYRLPELLASASNEMVFVCEGEKDVERLRSLVLVATTNPGGCRHGWKDEYSDCLRNKTVVILPDNDSSGARHAESIKTSVARAEITVVILKLPRLRRAEDVSDWLDFRGGTPEELHRQVAKVFAASRPARPHSTGGHSNRHKILTSRFSMSQEMILLVITTTRGQVSAHRRRHRASGQSASRHGSTTARCVPQTRCRRLHIRKLEHLLRSRRLSGALSTQLNSFPNSLDAR
jgi:hypothetical protein